MPQAFPLSSFTITGRWEGLGTRLLIAPQAHDVDLASAIAKEQYQDDAARLWPLQLPVVKLQTASTLETTLFQRVLSATF